MGGVWPQRSGLGDAVSRDLEQQSQERERWHAVVLLAENNCRKNMALCGAIWLTFSPGSMGGRYDSTLTLGVAGRTGVQLIVPHGVVASVFTARRKKYW